MSEMNYASYVTNQDTDLKNAQIGSIKEDPNQEKTKGSTVTLKTVPMIGHPEEIDQPHHGEMLQN